MFIPSTFKRPVSSWKALNLRKTLLMASSVRLKPLNCSRLPCVYRSEERFSRNAETDLVCRLLLEKKKLGSSPSDEIVDSAGPESFGFEEFVRLIADAIDRPARLVHLPLSA